MTLRSLLPRWSRAQWLLRSVVLAGPLLAFAGTAVEGTVAGIGWTVLVLVAAVVAALLPSSAAPMLAIGLVIGWWGGGPADPLHPAVLPVGAALVATHVAAMLAASGPPGLTPSRALVRLWLRRGLLVCLPLPLVYAVARGVAGAPEPPYVWTAGLVAALGTVLVGEWAFGRTLGRDADGVVETRPPSTGAGL